MSKLVKYDIPCPECKNSTEQAIFHSINTSIDNAAKKIVADEINFVTCKHCGNKFQVKTELLFNNMEKTYAIFYHPSSFDTNIRECENLKKMLGANFYLANPTRFYDWELFKEEIRRKEGITSSINKTSRPKTSPNFSGGSSFDNYWSCDICDGNSETGCQYFDPTECPRHS
jgi:hypothetical protein